jgi:Ca2+-transporting ATPase
LLGQVTHLMALLLWTAGALAFLAGTPELGWAIWAVVLVNAAFSFWQEYRAEWALAALRATIPAVARTRRGGVTRLIPAGALVPGDLLELEEGDRVSADARLVATSALRVDVATLTGESVPVGRSAEPVAIDGAPRPEIANLVFAGTSVAAGRGRAVVYATGLATGFGQVADLTASVERQPSTLEVQVARLVRVISVLSLGISWSCSPSSAC